jgi:hypothetical protein
MENRTAYLEKWIPAWRVFQYANQELDPDRHRVLVVGETRVFCLRIPALCPTRYNGAQLRGVLDPHVSPNQWKSNLRALGFTHILISAPEWDRLVKLKAPEYENLSGARIWMQQLQIIYTDGKGASLHGL